MLEPERPLLLLQALVDAELDALAFLAVHPSLTSSTFFSHPIVRLISSLAPHNVHFATNAPIRRKRSHSCATVSVTTIRTCGT